LLIVDRGAGSYRLMMLVRRSKLGGRIIIGNDPIARWVTWRPWSMRHWSHEYPHRTNITTGPKKRASSDTAILTLEVVQ
jgi:hypothetical protein